MVKKDKHSSSSETKSMRVGLRLTFVAIWFTLSIFTTNDDPLHLLDRFNTDSADLIVILALLGPIAIVIFPIIYQNIDVYNISERATVSSAWKSYVFSVIGTGIILGILLYLFMIIGLTLFYRF
jgi:hypothetical protein